MLYQLSYSRFEVCPVVIRPGREFYMSLPDMQTPDEPINYGCANGGDVSKVFGEVRWPEQGILSLDPGVEEWRSLIVF